MILVSLVGTILATGLGDIIPLFPIYFSQKGTSNFAAEGT